MHLPNPKSPACPVALGQELEVFYPDLGVPHWGIVYQIGANPLEGKWDVLVLHNSKRRGGVNLSAIEQFASGNGFSIRRSPESPQHRAIILERATLALSVGVPYFALNENCQHFTTWCYTGKPESPTIQLSVVALIGGAMLFGNLMGDSNKPKPRKKHRSRY